MTGILLQPSGVSSHPAPEGFFLPRQAIKDTVLAFMPL